MNTAGASFMNSIFLLKKELQAQGRLSDYVATMKWYNEFGEVYQDPFEYAGTTADRLRTMSSWRYLQKGKRTVNLLFSCLLLYDISSHLSLPPFQNESLLQENSSHIALSTLLIVAVCRTHFKFEPR